MIVEHSILTVENLNTYTICKQQMDVSIPVISATKAIENKVAKIQQQKRITIGSSNADHSRHSHNIPFKL